VFNAYFPVVTDDADKALPACAVSPAGSVKRDTVITAGLKDRDPAFDENGCPAG
jgi:hypothetical protein